MVKNVYWNTASAGFNFLNGTLSVIMLILGLVILVTSVRKWMQLWKIPQDVLVEKAAKGTI